MGLGIMISESSSCHGSSEVDYSECKPGFDPIHTMKMIWHDLMGIQRQVGKIINQFLPTCVHDFPGDRWDHFTFDNIPQDTFSVPDAHGHKI